MSNSFDKAQATASLVNGASIVLGAIHLGTTIISDLAIKGEVRLKTRYLGQSAINVAKARVIATATKQAELGLVSTLALLSENLED